MSAQRCTDVTEYGTVDDNFDSVDSLASTDVSYNPPTDKIMYEARDTTITAIHNIQRR